MATATKTITDTEDSAQWEANFGEQNVPDAELLARAAVELGLGEEVIDSDGFAIPELVRHLAVSLLKLDEYRIGQEAIFAFSAGSERAIAVRNRLASVLQTFGDDYTYKRGGESNQTVRGRHTVMNTSTKFAMFTSTETAAWLAPAYILRVAGALTLTGWANTAPAVGDDITIQGADHNVYKIAPITIDGVVIFTLFYCART